MPTLIRLCAMAWLCQGYYGSIFQCKHPVELDCTLSETLYTQHQVSILQLLLTTNTTYTITCLTHPTDIPFYSNQQHHTLLSLLLV
jgi:hypothetical protein